jgi:hypothetical protein
MEPAIPLDKEPAIMVRERLALSKIQSCWQLAFKYAPQLPALPAMDTLCENSGTRGRL